MKKISYTTKTPAELTNELVTLRAALHTMTVKGRTGKVGKEYATTRKNIARVLTAQNAVGSTKA